MAPSLAPEMVLHVSPQYNRLKELKDWESNHAETDAPSAARHVREMLLNRILKNRVPPEPPRGRATGSEKGSSAGTRRLDAAPGTGGTDDS